MKKGFEGFDKEGSGTINQTTMQVSIVLPIVELDHPHVADDPEEHVGGVQQDGHGQLRRRGGRGGEREVHICPVLLGENLIRTQFSKVA